MPRHAPCRHGCGSAVAGRHVHRHQVAGHDPGLVLERPGYTTGLGKPITILRHGLIAQPAGVTINDSDAEAGSGNDDRRGHGDGCSQPVMWHGGTATALPEAANRPSTGQARAFDERLALVWGIGLALRRLGLRRGHRPRSTDTGADPAPSAGAS